MQILITRVFNCFKYLYKCCIKPIFFLKVETSQVGLKSCLMCAVCMKAKGYMLECSHAIYYYVFRLSEFVHTISRVSCGVYNRKLLQFYCELFTFCRNRMSNIQPSSSSKCKCDFRKNYSFVRRFVSCQEV